MKKSLTAVLLFIGAMAFPQDLMITDGSLDFHKNGLEKAFDKEWNDLDGSPEFSTAAEIELYQKYLALWDRELNHFYQAVLRKLPPAERKMLVDAQKAWLDHYEKEKIFLNELLNIDFMNGSGGQVGFAAKLLNEKKDRVYELMEYYYMFGGSPKLLFDGR